MYCRNCGKELPDDSKFCPNCGSKQDGASKRGSSNLFSFITNLYRKHKAICIIYGVWGLLHITLFIAGDRSHKSAQELFYPFHQRFSDVIQGYFGEVDLLGEYTIDGYGTLELFVYTVLVPLILFGLYIAISFACVQFKKLIHWKKSNKDCEQNVREKNEDETQTIMITKEQETSVTKPLKKKPEAEMVTMPLFKRLLASIIDKVVILLLILLSGLIYLLVSPYEAPGILGVITALLTASPKYFTDKAIGLETFVLVLIVTYNTLYFLIAENKVKASLGKYWLGGILLNSNKEIISDVTSRLFTRIGLSAGFILIFHTGMGLPSIAVLILYILINELPTLFAKQSLLDLMTGTIYAKRK